MVARREWAAVAALWVMPCWWWVAAGDAAIGLPSVDLEGHLWTLWNASQGPMTRSSLVHAPTGVDLLPVVGGWLDIRIGSWLSPLLGVARAYNAVLALYGVVAGLGGLLLARSLGATVLGGLTAGLLLQLDPFVLTHLTAGRPEQAALGLVAMALAGAVAVWRTPDWRLVGLTGVAGALVVFASWELGVLLATGMALALPVLFFGLRPAPGVVKRLSGAATVTAVLCGPWALAFLRRARDVRPDQADPMALDLASHASIGWLQFWSPGGGHPGPVPLLCLVALVFFARDQRRLWLGVWGVLGLAFVLGLGPRPSAGPGAPPITMHGPFSWLQAVPGLRWFHWPDRIVSVWGIAGAAATGVSVTRLSTRRRLQWGLVAAALALAAVRVAHTGRWPVGRFVLPESDSWVELREDETPGAVYDLPLRGRGVSGYAGALAQIQHGRPVRSYGGVPWLLPDAEAPFAPPGFAVALDPRRPVPELTVTDADRRALNDAGFGFLVLRRPDGGARWYAAALSALTAELGPPRYRDPALGWSCWAL